MARVSYVEAANAPAEVQEIYAQLHGQVGNVHKAMAHRPDILKGFMDFYSRVGRHMERRLYELVYIRVSMINQCDY